MSKRKTPIAKDLTKKFANQIYSAACAEPFLWVEKAREMHLAADLLWDNFHTESAKYLNGEEYTYKPFIGSVAMMLYAFTLENLLKACLVAKGCAIQKNGNFGLKGHELEDFANDLSVNLDQEERELLERLEVFLSWAGRYPIPLYKDNLYPREMFDGGKGRMDILSSGDRARIDGMITKIREFLPDENTMIESYVRFHTRNNCSSTRFDS